MQQTIEQLKDLFKQREEIDNQIMGLFNGEITPKPEVKKKRKYTRRKPKNVVEPKLKKQDGKNYHCENCDHEFYSDAHYLEAKCEKCNSRRLLTLKQ